MKPSITTVLVAGFGLLIVAGMALVLGISMWSAQKNTRALLRDNATIAVRSLAREVRGHLAPISEARAYVARLIASGKLASGDDDRLAELLLAASAAAPQIFGMGFLRADGRFLRVVRGRGAAPAVTAAEVPDLSRILAEARAGTRPDAWSEVVRTGDASATLLADWISVRRDGEFLGLLVASVAVDDLSRHLAGSGGPPGSNRFVLYGADRVLAHRGMAGGAYGRGEDVPLPRLDEVGDPALAGLRSGDARPLRLLDFDDDIRAHLADAAGAERVYLYKELGAVGGVPLTAGLHIGPEDGLGVELGRLLWAAAAGAAVILASVAAAVVFGRRVAAPIRALAAGSSAVADLEFDRVARLEPSRVRELDDAARAFNRMMAGLRWFEAYVPRRLVRQLVEGDAEAASEEKQVTVMFTDMAGFAALSEQLPAAAVVRLLNEHFSVLVACVEAEGGTVDKYIGDSMMAFWEHDDPGAADRVLRCAAAIRAGIAAENARRRAGGGLELAMRIGIHSGRAIVGNVGAAGRVNYTLIGDAVNVAARLEQLCKEAASGRGGVAVLASGETAALLSDRSRLAFRGRYPVRGRDGDIEVYEPEE